MSNLNPDQFRIDHDDQHPFGGRVARAYSGKDEDQKWLGSMRYSTDMGYGGTYVHSVNVEKGARRQGVATALYNAVADRTGEPFVHHRDEMSNSGKAAARALSHKQPEQHLWFDPGTQTAKKLRGT